MKKFLLGTVALAALAVPAMAADMGIRPRAVAYVPAFSWTGCHVGGLAGYEWGRSNGYTTTGASSLLFPVTSPPTFIPLAGGQQVASGFGLDGFNGGGYAGCDYQFGAWVVGVEGDWSVDNKSGQSRLVPTLVSAVGVLTLPPGANFWAEAQERWYATARARFGYAVDRWLFFVSGGGAWTKVDHSQFFTGATFSAANLAVLDSNRLTGWTVGAGVDYAPPQLNGPFNGQWVIRAEYLYVRFNDYTAFTNPSVAVGPGGFPLALSTRLDDHIVRFGLAYKFGNFAYAVR